MVFERSRRSYVLRHQVTSFRQFDWRRVTLYAVRPMSSTISHSCDYDYGSREVSRCDISMTFASPLSSSNGPTRSRSRHAALITSRRLITNLSVSKAPLCHLWSLSGSPCAPGRWWDVLNRVNPIGTRLDTLACTACLPAIYCTKARARRATCIPRP